MVDFQRMWQTILANRQHKIANVRKTWIETFQHNTVKYRRFHSEPEIPHNLTFQTFFHRLQRDVSFALIHQKHYLVKRTHCRPINLLNKSISICHILVYDTTIIKLYTVDTGQWPVVEYLRSKAKSLCLESLPKRNLHVSYLRLASFTVKGSYHVHFGVNTRIIWL